MYSHDGMALITFNGEIYNYLELREELATTGARFRTKSDTEVILELFRAYGRDAFAKLNGQFAFGLYDIRNERLFLVRDRLGEKPLYVARFPEALVFASELKAILCWKSFYGKHSNIWPEAMLSYLALNYLPLDETILEDVRKVSPGSYMELSLNAANQVRYWELPRPQQSLAAAGLLEQFEFLLHDAARIRLRSDVPCGVFLSGGIDSSLVCRALSSITPDVCGYTADFREESFSEIGKAEEVARILGIRQQSFTIDLDRADLPALIESLVYHGDEPLADSSALPVYLLSQQTAKQVKVVLSGDGGDELFAGYLTYPATLLQRSIPRWLRSALASLGGVLQLFPPGDKKVGLTEKLDRFFRSLYLPPGAAHFAWNGMFHAEEKRRLLTESFLQGVNAVETFESLASKLSVSLERPQLHDLMRADQMNYLPNDILAKVDRMSMAHGLEVRPVLLDHRIVELAQNIPDELLLRGLRGKVFLRNLMGKRFPVSISAQKKQGFSIPVHAWFRTKLREFAGDLFHSSLVEHSGIYRKQALLELWERHQRVEVNRGFELWGIMVSLLWFRRFMSVNSG